MAAVRRLLWGEYLTDEMVIAATASLLERNTRRRKDIAILSPYDMTRWRQRSTPADAYRRVKWAKPWSRKIVLIPVHEDFHWTLVAAWPQHGRVEVFDSIGGRNRPLAEVRLLPSDRAR